jgi:uncharacterized protein YjbI with pentapeptide repeats
MLGAPLIVQRGETYIWQELTEGKPLPVVVAVALVVAAGFGVLLIVDVDAARGYAGWSLLAVFVLGIALALAAPHAGEARSKAWSDLGRSFLVAGLMAFAVWLIGDLRRPLEERGTLQVTLGLQQEMPGADLHGKNLDGFDLSERNLEGADLEGAHLSDASLVGSNLVGANLAEADLSGANLEEARFDGADLSNADLEDVEADLAHLRETRLLEADLSGAELSGADLRGACLAGGRLVDASLPDARLRGAALTGADLEGARFWLDLRPAYLGKVGLAGAEHADDARWPPSYAKRADELIAPGGEGPPAVVSLPRRELGSGRLLSVPDGDTVLLSVGDGRLPVRLSGVDAPDLREEGGGDAKEMLRRLLPQGSKVTFVYDKRRVDDFGRRLLYLFNREGKLVNQLLVQRGSVVARLDPPSKNGAANLRYAPRLEAAETWARQHALGLWEECPP